METTIAPGWLPDAYQVLTDLGAIIAGILALLAGLLVSAALRRQARAASEAAAAELAVLREQMAERQRLRDAEDERRRDELRFALAGQASRIGELAAHRYRIIPLEYGPGRLETVARTAGEIYRIRGGSILRRSAGAGRLLDAETIAAAAQLDASVDALNSLLAVEGALGRLEAVDLLTAFETVMQAAKRLHAATVTGPGPAPRMPRRVAELLGAAEG